MMRKRKTMKNNKEFTSTPFLTRLPLATHKVRRDERCRGFTLIETLVGIAILLLAVTGTLTTVATNLSFSSSVREEVTAFFLASEAMEVIRNTRDNNSLEGNPWLQGIQGNCGGSSACIVDATKIGDPTTSCGTECPNLQLNSAGVYQYSQGAETPFRREVRVNVIHPAKEAMVEVSVFWKRRGIEKSFSITENILNWQN
ncbi:MAG: type II secretion system protein [Candidatus Paceibacterota bacterium]